MRLGSQENPCRSNYDINRIIRGMQNCNIYTIRTFEISDENIEQAKARNIKFVGLAEAYFVEKAINKAVADAMRKENISQIGIDASTKVPVNLDEIAETISKQFGINIEYPEVPKTALDFRNRCMEQEYYKRKILGEW